MPLAIWLGSAVSWADAFIMDLGRRYQGPGACRAGVCRRTLWWGGVAGSFGIWEKPIGRD
ncbi:hypothetical protein thsps21_41550 [Pseudomonas sp. No.21]|nr:hypothetical protein TUM20249_18510 [Pseudomonas tohonis]